MSIYLSAIFGSRDLDGSAIDKAISAMAIHLTQIRNAMKINTVASIDLTLMLPGKTHQPDFEGMRMPRFSSADSVLYIESAVPEHMLHSEQAERYVSALVQDAVENAADFFAEQGLPFDSTLLQKIFPAGS